MKENTERQKNIKRNVYYLRYIYGICMAVAATILLNDYWYVLSTVFELVIVYLITGMLYTKSRILSYIFNIFCILLIDIQLVVITFGGSYISLIMLNNISFIKDLEGKFVVYAVVIILLIISLIGPIHAMKKRNGQILSVVILTEILMLSVTSAAYSPIGAYAKLYSQYENKKMYASDTNLNIDKDIYIKSEITDYYKSNDILNEKPNVILLFTEGLSQNIIDDSRNIMPNMKEVQRKSISFDNYYNHTAATCRGLIGQLYSGYQGENLEVNNLISIEEIMKNQGYDTFWINTEPNNNTFTKCLESFGFEKMLTDENSKFDGAVESMTDENAYEFMLKTAEEQAQNDTPFFIAMYTFGTHATLDGMGEKFENGNNNYLNKFYNVDFQFGKFIEKFEQSQLASNTIVIMTSDHCTCQDVDFNYNFPNYERADYFVDEIPLFIYYEGVEAAVYDAGGRNSLDLAPTILDMLDISAQNYFLGDSLFAPMGSNDFDMISTYEGHSVTTKDGIIEALEGEQLDVFTEELAKYITVKIQGTD